ncbi:MAG: hypothetical protein CM1200mP13_08640 [Candidatus Pelagibacterales bacterium]|nr:MAG: hypothetical protein CM1200mP13_08640 [Pelagibacterales bacterium]
MSGMQYQLYGKHLSISWNFSTRFVELGKEARFNIPGQQLGNWNWRLESLEPLNGIKDKLLKLNKDTKEFN